MLEQNQTCMFDKYRSMGEQLDDKLEYLKLFGTDIVVHVYDRNWSVEMTAMKYSATLRLRLAKKVDSSIIPPAMDGIGDVKEGIKGQ